MIYTKPRRDLSALPLASADDNAIAESEESVVHDEGPQLSAGSADATLTVAVQIRCDLESQAELAMGPTMKDSWRVGNESCRPRMPIDLRFSSETNETRLEKIRSQISRDTDG